MLSNINTIKILKVISNSSIPNIIDISSTSDEFILKAINFSKSKSLFIHAINSNPQNKNYKNIKYIDNEFTQDVILKNFN